MEAELVLEPTEVISPLSGLSEEKIELARLVALGHRTSMIAYNLDRSLDWVRKNRKDPAVINLSQELVSEALSLTKNRVKHLAQKAIDVMEELLSSPNDNIRLSAARDLLDRSGAKSGDPKAVLTQINVSTLSNNEIMERLKILTGADED